MKCFSNIPAFLSFLCVLCIPGMLDAQNPPAGSLLVLSKQDHTLVIVDPRSLKILARVPVGEDPHEVIASSDGKTAYVSNYGGGTLHTLAVIDLSSQTALDSIDLSPLRGPHGLAFVGGKTWFTAEGSKAIGSYDPRTRSVDWILGTGQNRTHMIYVSRDLQRIITTNVSSGTASIIEKIAADGPAGAPPPSAKGPGNSGTRGAQAVAQPGRPKTDWNETLISVGSGSEGFDVSPDGKEAWVANAGDGTVSIIDLSAKKVIRTLDAKVVGANRLKFTPDGKRVLISSLRGTDLVILDASEHKEIKRLPIGHGAAGILMQPDGSRAFVACTPDNYVTVIALPSLEVAGRIQDIGQPDGLAWAVRP